MPAMLGLIRVLILLLCCAVIARAYQALGYYSDPANAGKCTIGKTVLSPGETARDPNLPCGEIFCGVDGATLFSSCGVHNVKEGCTFSESSLDKTYPECCAIDLKCPEDESPT